MKEISDLKKLFDSQRLAVLATQSEGQPHGCLVAFACSDDLKYLFFTTSRNTRKYNDIHMSPKVAMLIDSRSNTESDFANAIAVTARGIALELSGADREKWMIVYLQKQSQLSTFASEDDTAFLKIDVDEYLIAGFRSTHSIKP